MPIVLRRWGNGSCVRLPKPMLAEPELTGDTEHWPNPNDCGPNVGRVANILNL